MSLALDPATIKKIEQLKEKFKNSNQDLNSYLDGLLHDRYLTYWDYIHLDTLLSLQIPKTQFPDELIFITYHQITELYFKLIIHEIEQIINKKALTAKFLIERLGRINKYFDILTDSFDVMIAGMEKEQFLKFRMSLLPASGFQSVQFRMIEILSTPLHNLVNQKQRPQFTEQNELDETFEHLYWKSGATESTTGKKTLTLKQFEERYTPRLKRNAHRVKHNNILYCYNNLPTEEKNNATLIESMRTFDANVNINWSLSHLRAAHKYLSKKEQKEQIKATGGTNWKEFLPPSFQKIKFFPNLWNTEEHENWGKNWVENLIN